MDQEDFAKKIREAGMAVGKAEFAVLQAEAEEKKIIAQVMVIAEARGAKTNAHQLRSADEDNNVFEARLAKGRARGQLAAAKAEALAAEVEFKIWQSKLASERAERRVYGT
jgi:hypothetical protein